MKKTAKIILENIKTGVNVFDIVGTNYYSFDPSTLEYIENFDDYNKLAKLEMPLSTLKNITKTVFPYYVTIDKETDQIIDYNNSSYVAISYFCDNSCIFINIPIPV